MSFLTQFKAVHNEEFRGRAIAALQKTARFILAEDPQTPAYQQRRNLAEAIIREPEREDIVTAFVWECAANGTIEATVGADGAASANDSDFEYVVGYVWNTVVNLGNW